jgi:CBS domain-containing protein
MSLEQDLQAEIVGHLDLSLYLTVEDGTQVKDVLQRMREQRRNCVLVTNGGRLAGIFTERDVLRKVVNHPETWDGPVVMVMTAMPHTVRSDDLVAQAIDLMNSGHFRNMPVVDSEGKVTGNLTQYAIIQFLCDHFPQEVYNLPPDPDQTANARDGA